MNSSRFFGRRWAWWWGAGLIVLAVATVLLVRPPGEVGSSLPVSGSGVLLVTGNLPGVTWADDIHPIFVRNRCGDCHTRGREARVDGLTAFSLGLLDPEDPGEPFYSYHELVYAEGPPLRMEGETLRDGLCCWPRDAPVEERRRIWPGHPGRSVLLRKLERDFYGWNRPPRFLEEGLRLRWGLPMPWGHATDGDPAPDDHVGGGDAGGKATIAAGHEPPESESSEGYEEYPLRSWPGRVRFRAALWLGRGTDQLIALPPPIPATDRLLLRRWILDAFTTTDDRTGLDLQVENTRGRPVAGASVELVGNYTSPVRRRVEDRLSVTVDGEGQGRLDFPRNSVVTRTWYARVVGFDGTYRQIRLAAGSRVLVVLTATPAVAPSDETPRGGTARTAKENRPHPERGEHR